MGTSLAVESLALALPTVSKKPNVVGCVLPIMPKQKYLTKTDMPILGDFSHIKKIIKSAEIELVLLSLPRTLLEQARKLAQILDQLGVTWQFIATLDDQLAGHLTPALHQHEKNSSEYKNQLGTIVTNGMSVNTQDLINRQPYPLNEQAINQTITDQTVLITGAGGSIGSELSHIVCRFKPRKLILLERSENSLFEVKRHLARQFPEQSIKAILHDVTDASRTMAVVREHLPNVIFHAAAHKHVPVMEDHPAAAVENNFYGTRSIADAARLNQVDRFVMISTDKAVNPSSIMGASKRMAELYIRWLNAQSKTVFSMVRFGNVLGSACSVLPIWSQQLSQGLPVTVTDPRMTRYFMTIPEAAGLVIESAAYTGTYLGDHGQLGGEVFLLDMGTPVNILDLAKRFILAQGLTPNLDVPIQITGARPGEKLFEELAYDGEDMLPTPHQAIRVWKTKPTSTAQMQRIINTFDHLRERHTPQDHLWQYATDQAIVAAIRMAVPEMLPSSHRAAG